MSIVAWFESRIEKEGLTERAIIEGEEKKSTLTFLSLEAISYARVLQSLKIRMSIIKFPHFIGNLIIDNLF